MKTKVFSTIAVAAVAAVVAAVAVVAAAAVAAAFSSYVKHFVQGTILTELWFLQKSFKDLIMKFFYWGLCYKTFY